MKDKEIKYKLQVEAKSNYLISKAIQKNNDNIKEYNDNNIIFKYKDKKIKSFNGFIGQIIPGEIVREEINGIAKSEAYCMYRIQYYTKYYNYEELREKLLNKKNKNQFEEKKEEEGEIDSEINSDLENLKETIKYDISEVNENNIINNLYNDEIKNYIIEDRTKCKNKVKNTLIRFVFTNTDNISRNFNANIFYDKKTNNIMKLNGFFPKEIIDNVKENNIKYFLNIYRFRDDLEFFKKDNVLVSLEVKKLS